jgi:hypothetical protein
MDLSAISLTQLWVIQNWTKKKPEEKRGFLANFVSKEMID